MNPPTFASRESKALKIQRILADYLGQGQAQALRCLDLGCGTGEISQALASQFRQVVGLDYDFELIRAGTRRAQDVRFAHGDGTRLPFGSATFDVVVCAQVYEHVHRAEKLPGEIERVLRPGGVCFFSGPNKVWPIEPHYGLPFLHWLPMPIATRWLQASGRGTEYDIRPFSYWHLRRLWRRFERHDYTIMVLKDSHTYGVSMPFAATHLRGVVLGLMRVLYFLLPNYNWIMVKSHE